MNPSDRRRRNAAVQVSTAGLALMAWHAVAQAIRPSGEAGRPERRLDEGYVGSEACAACHARNHETWHASYHRTMTQVPSSATVLAPFEGRTPALEGVAWRLDREGEAFFATPLSAADAVLGPRRRVALTTGWHHYQIYWLESGDAAGLEQLPLVWHRAEGAWVPRKSMFLTPPVAQSGTETGRWQNVCIKCHTTNGTQQHALDQRTTVAELGIACEACHGPGAAHVAKRRGEEAGTSAPSDDLAPDPTIVHPGLLAHDRASEVCGQCHGIHPLWPPEAREPWEREGFAFRPGQELSRTRQLLRGTAASNSPPLTALLAQQPELLATLFWPDGEVRVSGREYNGLVESPCFQRGELSCLSCHELHPPRSDPRPLAAWADDQLRAGMDGSPACLQCHGDYAAEERLRAHTRHAADSPGSECLNCHMPHTTYGLTKAIRSHTVTSPSVAATLASGRPNACNLCHLDRTLGWTAERLSEWYGHARPALDADRESVAAAVLWALEGDAGVRALTAWHLGWEPARAVSGTGWMPYLHSTLLMDPYDAVRRVALDSLRRDARYAGFTLDFTLPLVEQQNAVRESVLADWQRDGLEAAPERAPAVLVRPDGTLDEPSFRRIFARRDQRDVRLSE